MSRTNKSTAQDDYVDLLQDDPLTDPNWDGLSIHPTHQYILNNTEVKRLNAFGPVASLFLALVKEIGPNPDDKRLLARVNAMLSMRGHTPFTVDLYGNGFATIDTPDGFVPQHCFAAHLDTVATARTYPALQIYWGPDGHAWSTGGKNKKYGLDTDLWMRTDGKSVLGADDRAGMAVLLHLYMKGVPGVYALFTSEEGGRIGSEHSNAELEDTIVLYEEEIKDADAPDLYGPDIEPDDHPLGGVTVLLSLDRYGTEHVVYRQSSQGTGSREYAGELAKALNKVLTHDLLEPNTGGTFTDSYSFRHTIPECLNLSVGYVDQHTTKERQNLTYLDRITTALAAIDFDDLSPRETPLAPFKGGSTSALNGDWYGTPYSTTPKSPYSTYGTERSLSKGEKADLALVDETIKKVREASGRPHLQLVRSIPLFDLADTAPSFPDKWPQEALQIMSDMFIFMMASEPKQALGMLSWDRALGPVAKKVTKMVLSKSQEAIDKKDKKAEA